MKNVLKVFITKTYLFLLRPLPKSLLLQIKQQLRLYQKLDVPNLDIQIEVDSPIELAARSHPLAKEPETVQWIETYLKPGDTFYDIGANIGAFSLIAAKHLDQNTRIYAFEPSFTSFSKLCHNILLNDCQMSITPLQLALSDETKATSFFYENLDIGGALHSLIKPVDFKGESFEPKFEQKLYIYQLDDVIHHFHLLPPDHIKIDIDGHELNLLKGMRQTLKNKSIKSILLEIEKSSDAPPITKFLSQFGMSLKEKFQYSLAEGHEKWSDSYTYLYTSQS